MQCHTELIKPTAVTHAVALPFVSSTTTQLIVAKTSILQVFDLCSSAVSSTHFERLTLVDEYSLSGSIVSLARVKLQTSKSGGDALLIAFQDAKLSLVEWNPAHHNVRTISIHFYEADNVLRQPFGPSLYECSSILTVDPESRCAALKFGPRKVAILPFRQAGDDLADEEDLDLQREIATSDNKALHGDGQENTNERQWTPYKSSFVLPLTALDPALLQTLHLAFLHEYREPTFGILSGSRQPSTALLAERKDCLTYTIFTLDLEQRASTHLLTVENLPSTLFRIVPLSAPVGGALLIGANELIHIDQSGKTNATAVNEFAKLRIDFNMADQSALNLRLEDCEIVGLESMYGEMLLILRDGSLAILSFKLLGRTVGGLELSKVPNDTMTQLVEGPPSCAVGFGDRMIFVGSANADSALFTWERQASMISRKRSHAQILDRNEFDNEGADDESDEDDLYATAAENSKTDSSSNAVEADKAGRYKIKESDRLVSLAPINNLCMGKRIASNGEKLEMLAAIGRGQGSRLACLNREVAMQEYRKGHYPYAQRLWSLCINKMCNVEGRFDGRKHDQLVFLYDGVNTRPYHYTEDGPVQCGETEFETEGETLEVDVLAAATRVVQVRRTEIRTYDANLGLSQIIPQTNDDTDEELRISHVSVVDPYLLVLREDGTVQVHQVDKSGDVEPLDVAETAVADHKWISGCVYCGCLTHGESAIFLLDGDGAVRCFSLPSLEQVYTAATLPYLPLVLSDEVSLRRMGSKETLTDLLIADLGEIGLLQPCLILRMSTGDLAVYKHFHATGSPQNPWHHGLRFRRMHINHFARFEDIAWTPDPGRSPLKIVNVDRHVAICISGSLNNLLFNPPKSLPHVIGVHAGRGTQLEQLNFKDCGNRFCLVDSNGHIQECTVPHGLFFESGWCVRYYNLGQEIRHVAYLEKRNLYVITTCLDVDFMFVEEDHRHHEQDDVSLRPQVPRYAVHLLSAQSKSVLHSLKLPYAEVITSMKVMPLEVSEITHAQKSVIVLGGAALRGEDMPAKGVVTILDILDVVPVPEDAESGTMLHLLSREETKGAITTVESFNGGLLGTGQGHKLMVRGLKEDGSCLPVAFLDAQCQMSTLKSFGRSGLWIAGDCWKGLWFGGFTDEPYKLQVLAKSRPKLEVVAAEFLPNDGQLHILVADAQHDVHVLQYDPENPKSLSGARLLHRSTFRLGYMPTVMMLVPSTLGQEESGRGEARDQEALQPRLYHVLAATMEGSLSLFTPIDEAAYRRLTALQAHLTSALDHTGGLNPRAHRAVTSEEFGARAMVDGTLVSRVNELNSTRKSELLGRAGTDLWTWRADWEVIGGGGLGYL